MADPLEIRLRYVVIDDIDFTPRLGISDVATLPRKRVVDDLVAHIRAVIPDLQPFERGLFEVLKIIKPVPPETVDDVVNASETTRRHGRGESLSLAPILRCMRDRTAEAKKPELVNAYVKLVPGYAKLHKEFSDEDEDLISVIVVLQLTLTEEADRIKEDLEPGMIFRRKNLRGIINGGSLSQTSDEHGTNLRAYALMDRPANRYTFPVALFDQNLALLQYRLENLGVTFGSDKARQLFPEELTFRAAADQFITVAIGDYQSKDERMDSSRHFLEAIFGETLELEYPLARNKTLSGQSDTSTTTLDGAYVTMIKASGFPKITRVILGVKSTAYQGDALSQMTKGFAEEAYGFKDKNYFDSTYFPKILVALNGHKLEISIAVCLETVIVNQILSLDIQDNMFRSELQQKLSRVAEALKACSAQLDAYYSTLAAKRMPSCFFPSPTLVPLDSSKPLVLQSALDAVSEFPGLEIVARLGRLNDEMRQKSQPEPADMRHKLFLAEQFNAEDSSPQLVVKIVKRYGQKAHHCLAKGKLAPRLLLCQPIIGNLIIVIMERAKGRPLNFIWDDLNALSMRLVFDRLKEALTLLEREKLVHGDLRDVNILVDDSNPEAVTVNIVDFDWAAKHDEGFYPDDINVEKLRDRWHSDVGPLKKMRMEHDKFAILNVLGPRYFGKLRHH